MKKSLFLSGSFLLFVTNSVERTGKVLAVCLLVLYHILSSGDITAQINVTATAGNMGPVAYTTLKGAFDAINAGTHQGAITIDVNGDTNEGTATATLNASGSGMASYTSILMTPSGGAIRTISGATTAGNPLLDLNGADNVSIDGLNSGGNALTISNTTASSTSGTSTIRFIGGATGNTITNCSIQGSGSMAVATNGAVIFFSTDGVTANGNDNNTISNCNIGPVGANLPTKGILGNGSTTTTAIGNSGIIINNNNIFDFFGAAVTSSGVAINGGCNTWSITNNRFYQTAARTWTTGAVHRAIDLNSSTATSGVQGMTVTGNIIGFASNTQTGTYTLTGSTGKFQGIAFNGISTGTISNINNNTIAGVSLTGVTSSGTGSTASPFSAILINNGLVNTNSNTIGSQSSTGSLTFSTTTTTTSDFYGIYNFSVDDWTANSNNIGGISITNLGASGTMTFYGMRANTSGTKNFSAASNNVGGTVANSIQLTSTGASSQVIGIIATLAIATHTSNTVRNLTNNNGTGTTTSASVIGMSYNTTTPNQIVSQNTIHTLTASSTTLASVVTGIQFTGGTANIVERNLIYNLLAPTTSASAEVNGIRVAGGTTTYRNNMIILGAGMTNAIGAAATNSSVAGIVGFNEALGTNNVWHNSIYIGGSPTSGSGSSYAFNGVQTTNTRSFRDNIFVNARSNAGATGKNYAIKINGTTPNPTGLTINNNVYYATGTGAVFGFFNSLDVANLAAWKVAVGQDAGSFEADPMYQAPTAATPDLHINPSVSTAVEAGGADVGVTDDYDGQTRASLTPVDIGADAGNFMQLAPMTFSSCTATQNNTTNVPTNSTNQEIISVQILTSGAGNPLSATSFTFSTNGTTAVSDIANARLFFTGTSGIFATGTQFGTTVASPNGTFMITGTQVLAEGTNYFWLTYDVLCTATPGDFVDAECNSLTVGSPQTPSTQAPAGNRQIVVGPLIGTYTVGTGGNYTSLEAAITDINTKGIAGNTTFSILNNLTIASPITLNQINTCGGSGFTLTIKPAASVAPVISGSGASFLINFNGADNVIIDGSNNGTTSKDLTIRNIGNGAVIQLTNDATVNLVKNTILESQNTSATSGTVFFSTSTGTLGNSNNTINNCDIRDRSDITGVPVNAVYSSGSAGAPNGSNTISGCRIFNWTASGVLVSSTGAGNGWTINPTSFYQTADRTTAIIVISIQGGSGHSILNNSIGGSAGNRSGAPMKTTSTFTGIALAVGTTSATSVQGNTISNLNISGGASQTFKGINITAGNVNVGTATGNILGGGTAAYDTIRTNYDSDLIENSGAGTVTISNNVLGNVSYYNAGGDRLFGIRGLSGSMTIAGNIIRDLKSNGTGTAFSFFPGGIWLATTVAGAIVENNQIYNITHTNTGALAYTIAGMYVANVSSTGTATEIRKNRIYNIHALGTGAGTSSPRIWGIYVASGSATYSNNMIALSGGANESRVMGMEDVGTGTNFHYFNSIAVSGTTTGGTNNSYAFNRSGTAAVTIKNNVFSNTRTGGSGFHVALANTNAAATGWAATASNNNNLYNTLSSHLCQWLGSAAANNRDLTGWQAAQGAGTPGSGGDANSFNTAPVFVSATDLHVPAATNTPMESGGANVGITTDIDNDTRPGPTGSVNGGATAPDIGVDEFDGIPPSPMMYVSSTTTQNNTTNVLTNSTHQEVIGIQVVTSGTTNPLSVTSISAHTNGTTNVADIANAKLWYTGNSASFATTTQFGSTIGMPSGAMVFSGSQGMNTGTNYFWLTYDVPCGATAGNVIDAECNTITISGSQTPTIQAPAGSRTIQVGPLTGTYTVGTGGNYTSLESAVTDINTKGLGGNTTLTILNNLTLASPVTINQFTMCGGSGFTLTIKPAASTSPVVSGASSTFLFNLNGADNVIIDGSNNGSTSKDMIIRNTGSGSVIQLTNDATMNLVKNAVLESQNTSITSGTVVFSTSTGTLGNSNNTINNCDIRDRSDVSGVPANAVYSSGSAGAPNGSNTISGCRIFNFTASGVLISSTGAGNGWTINPTSFYQTADRTTALTVISILGGNGHSLLNNSIGGAAADRSGAPMKTTAAFTAISLAVGTTTATSIQGNTISNLNISGGSTQTFRGITITSGNVNVGTITGNTLGGGAAAFDTIRTNYDSDLIENSGTGTVAISNNVLGNISYYNAGNDRLFGIRGTAGTITISNNIVRDLKSNGSGTGFSFFPGGIWLATTVAGAIVENNQVFNITQLNSGTSAYTIAGIYVTGVSSTGTATEIRKNKIYNLNALGTGTGTSSPRLWGIHVAGGSATYSNNMIAIAGGANQTRVNGIEDLGTGTNFYYFNSVSISGTTTAGTNNMYAFNRSGTSTVTIKNNVFSNTRTGGTGFHVSLANTNAAATGWAATASNNNDLYNNTPTHLCQWLGTAAANNRDLPGWQAAQGAGTPGSGGDANSWNIAPVFVSATDLHIPAGTNTPLESGGTNVGITTDIDNDTRPGPTGSVNGGATAPDIGVDEFDGTPASPMMYVSSTTTQNNIANVSTNTINQEVIGIQVVTSGILSPLSVTSISAHTNGTTNVADITNAKVWFTGSSPSFATTTQFGSTIAFPSGAMNFMGSATMATGTNYFWVTYDIPCAGTPGNVIDAECNTIVISGSQTPTVQAPAGSRTIQAGQLAGTYTVGTGGNYTTLESAVADINAKGLNGNTTLSLLNNLTLSGPVTINQWNDCLPGGYTLTISPAAGTAISITGNSGGTASALIKLNGADRVTIDGLNTGGASLSIENTSITGGTAVIWVSSLMTGQGATNNTIRNCTLKAGIAQNASTNTTYGVVLAGSTLNSSITSLAAGNDNDNNQITGNTILKCRYGIVCFGGSTTNPNLGTVIQNNTIGPNSFNADLIGKGGIVVREENGIQILGNTIQFIGGDYASQPTGGDRAGITLGTDASWTPTTAFVKNAVIANNKIHDIIEERTFSAVGIILGGVDGTNSTSNYVVNNMLYNIRANGTSGDQTVAIGLSAGKDDGVVFNTIYLAGDTDPNASATTPTVSNFGISISSTSVVNPTFKDNIIFNDLTSSSATTLKNANINIPASYVWGTGSSNVNDLYRNSSNPQSNTGCVGGSGGTFHATLSDWQTASSQDAMSFNILPVFVSPTNLHMDVNYNTLNNLGMPITGVTVDIDNDTRDMSTPDLGADEFSPVSCMTADGGIASGSTSFCGSGTPTITASGYSVGVGSTYQWMSATVITNYPNAGSPVPGQTNPALLVTGVVTQTTYYWLMVTCGTNSSTDSSNLVTVTIIALPTASITPPGVVNICPPTASQLLTATTNASSPTYVWKKDGVTIMGETNAMYTATATGIYTVVITDGVTSCTNTSLGTTVIFNSQPPSPLVAPASPQICANDNPVLLTASGSILAGSATVSSGTIAVSIPDFSNTGTSHSLSMAGIAAGVVVDSVITTFSITHNFDEDILVDLEAPNGQIINLVKGTIISSGTNFTNTRISSDNTKPAIPATGSPFTATYRADAATSGFQLAPSPLPTTAMFSSLYSTLNGTWKIRVYDDESFGTGTLTNWSLKIAYHLESAYTWTPNGMGSGLYTDMSGMTPYTGTPAPSVYAKPASTTTYTVTATSDAGCTSTGSVTVTVNPQPTITLGSNPSVCQGITSANLSYSATTGSPNQYSIDYDVTAQGQGFVDVTNAPLSASPIVLVVPGAAALGTYNATLTVRNSSTTCMSNTYPITVTVTTPPNAGTVMGTTPLCIGVMATYTSNGDMGGTWTSTNTSVATVNPTTGVVTAVAAGSTNITYTVDGGGSCLPTSSFQALTVDPALVLNTNDSGAGSLRDIIACVGDGATITIDASLTGQTITLTTGEININKNLTINGPGMLNLTISGNDASRIFHLQPAKTLTLSGMALTHGAAVTNGGAIWVEGMLNLQNIILQLNTENGTPKALTVSPGASITVTNTVNMNN